MRLFEVPTGFRAALWTRQVGIDRDDGSELWLDRALPITAVATGEYGLRGGCLRRRFTQCEPPLADHTDDVWVADGYAVMYTSPSSATSSFAR
jgi:hypothetical protein